MSLYDIPAHGIMLADTARFAAYRDALAAAVRPGCVVLDIGTGTGIHALLACRLGARHVHAIEAGDVIQVARDVARDNGLADRITFHHGHSTRITLPEPADVLVSDLRGVLPLYERHIPSIIDARRRLLRPGARLIAQRDDLFIAPVEAPEAYTRLIAPWQTADDLDMRAAQEMVAQQLHRGRFTPEQLLAPAARWATLDYTTIEDPHARAELRFVAQRDGTVHGFALWFDAMLADGIGFSNAPGGDELIYGMSFLPLARAVTVRAAATVRLDLEARLVGDHYLWRWQSRIDSGDDVVTSSQSSLHGMPLARRTLALAATDATPSLGRDGLIDREALAMIDGATPLATIAEHLQQRYPDAFGDAREALDHVVGLARRYAE